MQFSDFFYIDSNGYHTSDFPTIFNWLVSQYQGVYGADTQLSSGTKDGQWITIQAQAMYDCGMLGASTYNSFIPGGAQGVGLSRIVKINGLERITATNSTVDLIINGTVGTVITNGIAIDTLNQQWLLPTSVTIPSAGMIAVTATAQNQGAVAALAGTVTGIYTPTYGWQSVTNSAAATLGQAVEEDGVLRQRQAVSTANPSNTVFAGTIGRVANVPGVTASRGYENATSATDGNGQPAHSIAIVAAGGDASAIAQAILYKGPGALTVGTTSETVYDSRGVPNVINFYRPTVKTITVVIHRATLTGYASTTDTLIAQAVASAISALGIGNSVLLSKLYSYANLPGTPQGATFNITAIDICISGGTPAASDIAIAFTQQAFCDPVANVTVGT